MKRIIITALGKQGSGKTHLVKNKIIPNLDPPAIILDSENEYNEGIIFDSPFNFFRFVRDQKKNLTGIYTIKIRSDGEAEEMFKFANRSGKLSLVIEEASKYCNPRSISDSLYDLIHYGRHSGTSLVFIARRGAELPRDVTSQSTFIVSFQQTESRDINSLKQVYQDAEKLSDLTYNPLDPSQNDYMIFGFVPDQFQL